MFNHVHVAQFVERRDPDPKVMDSNPNGACCDPNTAVDLKMISRKWTSGTANSVDVALVS